MNTDKYENLNVLTPDSFEIFLNILAVKAYFSCKHTTLCIPFIDLS